MLLHHRVWSEVMQAAEPSHNPIQNRGNCGRSHVREVHLSLNIEMVEFGLEGSLDLSGIAFEREIVFSMSHVGDFESLRHQPSADFTDVGLAQSQAMPELLCGAPLGII